MKGHNGYHGCSVCKIKGEYLDHHMIFPQTHSANWDLRNQEELPILASKVLYLNFRDQKWLILFIIYQKEQGYLDVPIFMQLKDLGFDCIWSFVIDPMHQIFLGIVKKVTSLWIDKSHRAEPFSVYRNLWYIDQEFAKVQVPHDFGRKPRKLGKYADAYKGIDHIGSYMINY